MPWYAFRCDSCGPFEHWRVMQEAGEPMTCPTCQTIARRVYTAPGLVKTPPALANARLRAEKSAYAPEVVTRPRPAAEEAPAPATFQRSHGRPWQLGH